MSTTTARAGLMMNSRIRYRLAKPPSRAADRVPVARMSRTAGVALQAHHQVTGGSAEEEAVRQLDQVVDEPHGQAHVKPGLQLEQQVGAQERRQEVVSDDHADAGGEHQEQMVVVARDDFVDDEYGEQGQPERGEPDDQGCRDDPGHVLRLPEHRPQVPPGALRAAAAAVEVVGGLADDGDAGVRAAQVVHRHDPPPVRRVDDPDAVARGALEHDEMAELPVQDRSAGQVPKVVEVRPHAPCPQPVRARRVHDGQRGDAVAAGPGHVPQLAQVDALVEVAEHHGQAGRSAVGVLHLPDARDTPAHGVVPVPSIARNWRARRSASDSGRSTTDAWACRCASCATEAAAAPGSQPAGHQDGRLCQRREPGLLDGGVAGQLRAQAADPGRAPAGERDGEPPRARQVRAGHGRQQRGDRPGAAVDNRRACGALAGADDQRAEDGGDHQDERHPVSPVDPPGAEAHHAARGVAGRGHGTPAPPAGRSPPGWSPGPPGGLRASGTAGQFAERERQVPPVRRRSWPRPAPRAVPVAYGAEPAKTIAGGGLAPGRSRLAPGLPWPGRAPAPPHRRSRPSRSSGPPGGL